MQTFVLFFYLVLNNTNFPIKMKLNLRSNKLYFGSGVYFENPRIIFPKKQFFFENFLVLKSYITIKNLVFIYISLFYTCEHIKKNLPRHQSQYIGSIFSA
jgi:hypothetical protein